MQKEDLNFSTQLRKGVMEYLFLLILERGKAYPSEIIATLRGAGMDVKEASVYTILSRLTKEGKVSYQWQESTQGPPRKYFTITPYGHVCSGAMGEAWDAMAATLCALRGSDSFELMSGRKHSSQRFNLNKNTNDE